MILICKLEKESSCINKNSSWKWKNFESIIILIEILELLTKKLNNF